VRSTFKTFCSLVKFLKIKKKKLSGMGHAPKRLASTAAKLTTVSLAHLPKFPPKESLFKPPVEGSPPHYFSPTTWASQQPPPPSALSAFAHRIGLSSVLTCPETIQQACTHPSFASSIHASSNTTPASPTRTLRSNAQLATVGNALMGLFASEHMHAAYPYLPTRVLKAAITAHVGPLTCASVAQEMGVTPLLRWHRTVRPKIKLCT
jgi:large subunit ribosomal protein L44